LDCFGKKNKGIADAQTEKPKADIMIPVITDMIGLGRWEVELGKLLGLRSKRLLAFRQKRGLDS
jgi:hypothetical protein